MHFFTSSIYLYHILVYLCYKKKKKEKKKWRCFIVYKPSMLFFPLHYHSVLLLNKRTMPTCVKIKCIFWNCGHPIEVLDMPPRSVVECRSPTHAWQTLLFHRSVRSIYHMELFLRWVLQCGRCHWRRLYFYSSKLCFCGQLLMYLIWRLVIVIFLLFLLTLVRCFLLYTFCVLRGALKADCLPKRKLLLCHFPGHRIME